ncbi:PREDICTED: uncharacterized protein LOC109205508 [Nicotiana attenuata]|uniref:DUF1685 domain-containing protein n=1 Tax=Nicotiana attenuata TaxID=49451 RepID=A0A314KWC0_NICAT|nr:PREDICTED: uncharacterized protein LOC109205508 [Nicotiana attenuata]OIT33831.1 hypothetical protein A4A49_05197 [Nicotiana attenuata]
MDVEELLNLFNSYWFESEILKPKQPFSATTSKTKSNPNLESNEQILEQPKLSKVPTFMVRSQSDQCLSSKDSSFHSENSPKSVLVEPKLEPILSGKEYNEFQCSSKPGVKCKESYRRRKKNSKSLSELEFEELKGFMDLGFEFSDKDKESSLVSILPGLRRLGRENEENIRFEELEAAVSRPHLSEAWGVWEKKKKNLLKSWKINPVFGNEMEIKDQLRFWAHTVASTVR